jgi:hypothetical protein
MKQTTTSPTTLKGKPDDKSQTRVFVTMALDMSWRLAIVVLAPIIGGFKLDEALDSTPVLTIIGFIVAMAGMGLVMWRTLQEASKIPVSKKEKKD